MVSALIRGIQPRAERRSSGINKKGHLQDMHETICRLVAPVFKILTTPQVFGYGETGPGFFRVRPLCMSFAMNDKLGRILGKYSQKK